jgi:DNA-binding NarL/FixJ family response regulator
MATTRVVLADDHPMVRAGIRKLLDKTGDIQVVGETNNGNEALRLVKDLDPDVLLLDMEMPGLKGVEVARKLQAAGSPVRILVLSGYDDKQYVSGVLANGASGYLIKEEAPQMLVQAVRGVARGEQGWVSRRVAAQLAGWRQGKSPTERALTNTEKAVLQLVVAGNTNQQIASALDMREVEVEACLKAVFGKLNVSSRMGAAVQAVQEGLI